MAGFMSRCPFWSTPREKVECYSECPILTNELSERQDSEHCIFHICSESGTVNFRNNIKEDYGFLNLSIYDEEKGVSVNY
jgi:hypothetical protein